jgi:hypothetical protein
MTGAAFFDGMAQNLAPIYLDNDRVRLQGDPKPTVSKILQAAGKGTSKNVQVLRVDTKGSTEGEPCDWNEVIDRTSAGSEGVYFHVNEEGSMGTGDVKGSMGTGGREGGPSSGGSQQGQFQAGKSQEQFQRSTPESSTQSSEENVEDLERSPGTGGPTEATGQGARAEKGREGEAGREGKNPNPNPNPGKKR